METIYNQFLERVAHETPDVAAKRLRSAASQGPLGRPDSYQLLAEDGQSAWHIAEMAPAKKRKTVIFSDRILYFRGKLAEEDELWDEIINHHTVYLWRGGDIPLSDHEPITYAGAFWEGISAVCQQFRQDIAASLVAQGLNLDEFIIVDTVEYYAFLYAWIKMEENKSSASSLVPTHVNIRELYETIFEKGIVNSNSVILNACIIDILKQMDAALTVTSLKYVGTAAELREKTLKYVNLQELEISFEEDELITALQGTPNLFPDSVKMILSRTKLYPSNIFVMPFVVIKHLQVEFRDENLVGCDFSKLQGCESITLENVIWKSKLDLDKVILPEGIRSLDVIRLRGEKGRLRIPGSVEELKLTMPMEYDLDDEESKKLESMCIAYYPNSSVASFGYDFKNTLIKHVKVESSARFYPSHLPKTLESLFIRSFSACPNLSQHNSLQRLHIENMTGITFKKLPGSLVSLYLYNDYDSKIDLKELDLKQFPCLQELTLSGFSRLKDIKNIPASLRVLRLRHCRELKEIDLINLKELHKLEMNGMSCAIINCPKKICHIELKHTSSMIDLSSIEMCYSIELFGIEKIEHVKFPRKVVSVSVEVCGDLKKIDLGGQLGVKTFVVTLCNSLTTVGRLPDSLEYLVLTQKTMLTTPDIAHLTQLVAPPILKEKTYAHSGSSFDDHSYSRGLSGVAATLSDQYILQANEESSTAFLDLDCTRVPDSNTGRQAAGDYSSRKMKVVMYAKNKISKSYYRAHVLNQINLSNNNVTFSSLMTNMVKVDIQTQPYRGNETILFLKQMADADPQVEVWDMTVTVSPGKRFPIVTRKPVYRMEDLAFYTTADELEFYLCESTRQCFAMLKPGISEREVKFGYSVKNDHSYFMTDDLSESGQVVPASSPLLDQSLRIALDDAIKSKPELSEFILNPNLSLLEKMKKLADYCLGFKSKKSAIGVGASSLAVLIDNIINQQGCCRHRAQSFMALAHYLNIPANIDFSEDHAFVEFPLIKEGETLLRAFDVGGGDYLDLTPIAKRGPNPFDSNTLPKSGTVLPASSPTHHLPVATSASQNIFTASRTFSSIAPFLQAGAPRSPLILLNSGISPIDLNQAILSELKKDGFDTLRDHLYIHSPADFSRFMNAIQLHEGKRRIIPGPLRRLIKNGGVLVINWSQFDANQMASYKCILEQNGTIMGEPVSPALHIISLAAQGSEEACEAFLSRTTPYRLDPGYMKSARRMKDSSGVTEISDTIDIDLFHLPNWRERLLGYVEYEGHSIRLFDNGALIRALKTGATLNIYNAPDESELTDLLNRIRSEKKFYYNGSVIEVTGDFDFVFQQRENPVAAPNVTVLTQSIEGQKAIYLNSNNMHESFTRMVIDNDSHCASNPPGWFESHSLFYVSDYITKAEWQELISHASLLADKAFTFILLPGAEIEGIAKSPIAQQESSENPLIFTNDVDFCVKELIDAETFCRPLVIDITPETTYQDLIAVLLDPRDELGNISFTYRNAEMIDALQNDRSVILCGTLSNVLYQQLLPILQAHQSTYYLNGEQADFTGKLVLVMPHTAKESLNPGTFSSRGYSVTSYKKYFPDNLHPLIDKIDLLFKLVGNLSHSGLGQPDVPQLTYSHLAHLLQVLSQKNRSGIHTHNPIKGLLNYNYPKNGRNYAFINVISKCLFSSGDEVEHLNQAKILRLIKMCSIHSPEGIRQYGWELLNCLNVKLIHKILNTSAQTLPNIDFSHGSPVLSDEAINAIVAEIKPFLNETRELPAKPLVEHKAIDQLKQLLFASDARAIFLKGAPGAGKTHGIRALKGRLPSGHYHKGTSHIIDWLQAEPASVEPVVLHLDEANLFQPGTWDLLKGLFRDDKAIYYKGKEYPITPHHKVVFTGNEETLPGRYFHQFFQQYAETIHFAMPVDAWIKDKFILPALTSLNIPNEKINTVCSHLLWAFHHINDYQPHLEVSLRDINSLMKRFCLLFSPSKPIDKVIFMACSSEFSTSIQNPSKRNAFINHLYAEIYAAQPKMKKDKAIRQIADMTVPPNKLYIVNAMEQDLAICDSAVNGANYRRGILLEGGSGVGKSSICKAVLEEHGYTKDNADPKKRYYEISVDNSESVPLTLIKAFLEGSKVILDELNLNPAVEALLNDLLEGVLPTDNPYKKTIKSLTGSDNPIPVPGFQLYASQNAGTYKGRKPLSPALRNRLHMIYVDDYSRSDLITILDYNKMPEPEKLVDQFLLEQRQHPGVINTRNLFELMKQSGQGAAAKAGRS